MHGTIIDYSAIRVADIDVCFNPAAPSSEGATADFEVFKEQLLFESLQFLPIFVSQRNGVVGPPPSSILHPVWLRARTNKIRVHFNINPPCTVLRQPYPGIVGWSRNEEEFSG